MIAANPKMSVTPIRQSRRWPAIIIALLASHFLLMMVAVFVITHGNHDGIIRDSGADGNATETRSGQAGRLP